MIEVENLCKIYGTTPAIEDVSFSVKAGEILGFLGPNGAGKTTTLRILSGYLPATNGTARIAGYEVHEQSMAVRERIGYLPETPPLYPDMTVEGFLHFVARIKRVAAGDRPLRVQAAMERCGILDRRQSLIRKLSKGYRQRVGIAQAIVHDPPVIVLDEPTVGLDPRQIIEVRNLIKSLAGNHTIILSTHILPEVSMTCSQVVIINKGQIVATGTPDNLMEKLTAGAGYEIEVEGEIEEETLNSLLAVPGVKIVDLLTTSPTEPRQRLQVVCENNREPGPELIAACVTEGIKVYEMRRTRASLEDVFLTLTAQEEATIARSPSEDKPDSQDIAKEQLEEDQLTEETEETVEN